MISNICDQLSIIYFWFIKITWAKNRQIRVNILGDILLITSLICEQIIQKTKKL